MAKWGKARHIIGSTAFGISVVVLAGCSARPPENRVAAVASMAPANWSATGPARAGVDREWIGRFRDPLLEKLVETAMAGNLDLRVAAERVRRAEAAARLAGAALKPRVQGQITGSRTKQRFTGFPIPIESTTSETYGASLEIGWEMDLWGRVRAGQSAAMADLQAQGYDYRAAQTSLAGQIAKAWFALGEANEQVRLAAAVIDVRERIVKAVRERYEQALIEDGGLPSQLRLAESTLASSRATLQRWRGQREGILRQVELLAGRYPSGFPISGHGLPDPPADPPAGLPSELLLRRPDILAAERRMAAAGKRRQAARLARYPSFSLTGSRGTSTDSLHEVLNSDFGVWSLAGGVVQPLFAGGQLKQEERLAGADERIALGQLQQVVLRSFGEVEQALVADHYFATRLAAVEEATRLSKESAEAALQDFSDGAADALTLLEAQGSAVQTSVELVELRRLRLDNRIDLHLSLGGDFKLREK